MLQTRIQNSICIGKLSRYIAYKGFPSLINIVTRVELRGVAISCFLLSGAFTPRERHFYFVLIQ